MASSRRKRIRLAPQMRNVPTQKSVFRDRRLPLRSRFRTGAHQMDLKSGNPALSVKTFDGLGEPTVSTVPVVTTVFAVTSIVAATPCSIRTDYFWAQSDRAS